MDDDDDVTTTIPYGEICGLQFGLLTADDIECWNLPHVTADATKRAPLQLGSINCPTNGPSNPSSLCLRCGNDFENCQGHLSQLELSAPVEHVNYLPLLLKIFPTICIRCMRILAPNHLLKKLNQSCLMSAEAYRKCINDVNKLCSKTNRVCWFPDDNPPSEKDEKHIDGEEPHLLSMEEANERGYCGAAQPDLWVIYERMLIRPAWYLRNENDYDALPPTTPEKLYGMLKFMQDDLVRLYGFHPKHSPLHGMMIQRLCPLPPLARLSRTQGKPDDLTTLFSNIKLYNKKVADSLALKNVINLNLGLLLPESTHEIPKTPLSLRARSELVQYQGPMSTTVTRNRVSVISRSLQEYFMLHREIAIYMDSKFNSVLDTEYNRNPVCLRRRFAPKGGDHGQIRGRMLGKPSEYCARGVASCDSSMNIDETGVPLRVAMHVTIPEIVTPYNFNTMLRKVMNGKTRYPGCNFIQDEEHMYAPDANNNGLELSQVVHCHLVDGSPIIANRAPSLHRYAIMGYRARIHPYATIAETLSVCGVLNLDFDGDEVNLNVPQTEAQKAEVKYLLTVKKNLIRDNELIIGCVQHSVIGAECATNERISALRLSRSEIQQLLVIGDDLNCRKQFDQCWFAFNQRHDLTGRQFIHLILPTYDGSYILTKKSLNLCIRETIRCVNDMENAAALIGFITRILETIAAMSGTSVLLQDMVYRSSEDTYADAENVLYQAKKFGLQQKKHNENRNQRHSVPPPPPPSDSILNMVPRYLELLGLQESDIGADNEKLHKNENENGGVENDQDDSIKELDAIELEDDICETLGRFRDVLGRPLLDYLANKSFARSGFDTIVASGAKGDVTAVVQNLRAVGQQNNENSLRYQDSTSHYYRNECAKYGFAQNALVDSLTPTEYFFCLRSGRVGLVRTSCETAGIGYVYRKLFKSLEDLRICFGNTVRNASGNVILFSYGYDTTFLRSHKLETVNLNVRESVARFATRNDKSSALEVEHLMLLRQRVVLSDYPVSCVLLPLQFDQVPESVCCEGSIQKKNQTERRAQKRMHRCVPMDWNAVRNRVCSLWNNLVIQGEIPSTPAHELCFFEQMSTRMLHDRGYLRCFETFDRYVTYVKNMLVSNVCCAGDACGMKCSQDTTQPGTQAGLSLFRIAGEKTTVLQGTERFKEIINLPKVMQQPMMSIYIKSDFEDDFDPMTLVELRLTYIVDYFDDKPIITEEHKENDDFVYLSLYLNKEAMHRRQLSPRIVAKYLHHVRVLLFDIDNVQIVHSNLIDERWWVTIGVPCESLIWKAVAPEPNMENPTKSALLMHTLKTDKMLLAGVEGIRDFKVVEKSFLVADDCDDGKLVVRTRKCILTQGSNLQAVCSLPGIDITLTTSTNIWQVFQVFGIDAAENAIYEGLMEALNITSESAASQHVKIIAATMCFSGKPSPMTYSGMTARDPESWLQRALFERSYETFRGVGIAAHYNNMRGVSPAIMVGSQISLGTGGDFQFFNKDEVAERLTSSTKEHKMAAVRFLEQGAKPLDTFQCPKPFISDFLTMVHSGKSQLQDRIQLKVQAPPRNIITKKRKQTTESSQQFSIYYLTANKGTAIFVPTSPTQRSSQETLAHHDLKHLGKTFVPTSPTLSPTHVFVPTSPTLSSTRVFTPTSPVLSSKKTN